MRMVIIGKTPNYINHMISSNFLQEIEVRISGSKAINCDGSFPQRSSMPLIYNGKNSFFESQIREFISLHYITKYGGTVLFGDIYNSSSQSQIDHLSYILNIF